MNPELELLLEIQDLQAQRDGLAEEALRLVESEVFDIEVEGAVRALQEKIEELKLRLTPTVRSRYERLSKRGVRIVVPVLQGVCYGCFMAVPTAWASEVERNARIDVCEHCGRFLYRLD